MSRDAKQRSLELHRELKGKLDINPKRPVESMEDLSLVYTPGVGEVSKYVHEHPQEAREYTGLNNSVAVVSDGTAVLGLGDIGPHAALPVMEGKSVLFKSFAGIDSVPIVLGVHSADEIVAAVKAIAPSFGAINLEDIAAPQCFEIEDRLKKELDIPVMHDDQHGTAVVVLAGMLNALKITGKQMDELKVVMVGAGAAGTAIAKLLRHVSEKINIVMVDSKGVIHRGRQDLNEHKKFLAELTGAQSSDADMTAALKGADVFIGVSKGDLLTAEHVRAMAPDPIIFALANPYPEILPDEAKKGGAAVIATGRSDFPNQVNNALAFPGIFRGALDNRVNNITDEHKLKAAQAIAGMVSEPKPEMIIPDVFDKRLVPAIAEVIK